MGARILPLGRHVRGEIDHITGAGIVNTFGQLHLKPACKHIPQLFPFMNKKMGETFLGGNLNQVRIGPGLKILWGQEFGGDTPRGQVLMRDNAAPTSG